MLLAMRLLPSLLGAATLAALTAPAAAQGAVFQTPGMPIWAASGQLDRFANDLNPAIGALLDAFGDYREVDGGGDEDGTLDLFVRSFEMTVNGRVDPNWWGYAVIVYADDEVELEEAAVTYDGWDSNTTMRFGRFYVDFGKQMQAHIHDLPYPDRPGVLGAYLGDELPGVGVQLDHWWATGDESALRASLGLFGEFEVGGHSHGDEAADEGAEAVSPERFAPEDISLSARVTQFMDAGQRGVFQWGLSARHVGGFDLVDEANGAAVEGLSNTVFGLDLTYGVDSPDGLSGWTFGLESLLATGDQSAEFDPGAGALAVYDDSVSGHYLWAERRLDVTNTVGALFSTFEHPEDGAPRQDEFTAYYTRYFSEFARLRFAASHLDSEEDGGSTRLLVQLTTFFGPHAHGVNW